VPNNYRKLNYESELNQKPSVQKTRIASQAAGRSSTKFQFFAI